MVAIVLAAHDRAVRIFPLLAVMVLFAICGISLLLGG